VQDRARTTRLLGLGLGRTGLLRSLVGRGAVRGRDRRRGVLFALRGAVRWSSRVRRERCPRGLRREREPAAGLVGGRVVVLLGGVLEERGLLAVGVLLLEILAHLGEELPRLEAQVHGAGVLCHLREPRVVDDDARLELVGEALRPPQDSHHLAYRAALREGALRLVVPAHDVGHRLGDVPPGQHDRPEDRVIEAVHLRLAHMAEIALPGVSVKIAR
jgi:hypothetical protein